MNGLLADVWKYTSDSEFEFRNKIAI